MLEILTDARSGLTFRAEFDINLVGKRLRVRSLCSISNQTTWKSKYESSAALFVTSCNSHENTREKDEDGRYR